MSIFEVDVQDGVAVIWIDQPDAAINVITREMAERFGEVLDRIEGDEAVSAAVLISRKEAGFIAGADIRLFDSFTERSDVEREVSEGQALFGRLERLDKPVVAAIHGACLGGGLELAMACHYRLASTHPGTRFGQPEVNLGLLPAFGGCQRLPRLVGLQKGLELILSGKNVYAAPARKLGLVDATIHAQGLLDAAKRAARGLRDGSVRRPARRSGARDTLLEKTPLSAVVYSTAARSAEKRARGNYPALPRIIETVRTGMEKGVEAGLAAEARHFAELLFTPESAALRRLFFAQNAAKKNPWRDAAREVHTVGVLGAGLMGAGIAQVSAQAGYDVLLKDRTFALAADGKGAIYRDVSARVGRGLSEFERDRLVERVVPLEHYPLFRGAELTVEAVLESLELKREVLAAVEAVAPAGHVFASNTSSLSIGAIAEASRDPGSVLGMHYFSPVQKMPLLEVIRTDRTADWALGTAVAVGLAQGKTVIVVRDRPGFYANRILIPYLDEALRVVQEGASVEDVDEAMRDFGFPVGPLKLIDEAGIDVGAKIVEVVRPLFAERGRDLVGVHEALLDAGLRGRKSGAGFYHYPEGGSSSVNPDIYRYLGAEVRRTVPRSEIQERLAFAMVNEAVVALEEGIVEGPRDGDVGAVFGIGFPPFLGGPFFYLDRLGARAAHDALARLSARCGVRFRPAGTLERQAAEGGRFYPGE